MGVVGADQLDVQFSGDLDDFHVHNPVFGGAVILDFEVVIVPKQVFIPLGHPAGDFGPLLQNRLGHFSPQASAGDDQPLVVLLQ